MPTAEEKETTRVADHERYLKHREKYRAKRIASNRAWRAANKELNSALNQAWREKNKDRVKAREQEYRKDAKNRARASANTRARRYGLTRHEVEALIAQQDGKCAACGQEAKLNIDHDHATGLVRALLCGGCNTALGHLKDDATRCEGLLSYIRRFCRVAEKAA